jgi:two-component system copper resistance phosphate regulon response regulator CusR
MKILVIEDEPKTEMLALSDEYDLIVLDVMLPGRDGWQILQTLRKSNPVPVLVLNARDAVEDRVRGLELWADDYLPQPFAFAETAGAHPQPVAARVRQMTETLRVPDLDSGV